MISVSKNRHYKSKELSAYYDKNRHHLEEFYLSERSVISRLKIPEGSSVLDIGCASGGLYGALSGMVSGISYTGIDINPTSIELGKKRYPTGRFICGDYASDSCEVHDRPYDYIFSLSCIDWNEEFQAMFNVLSSALQAGSTLVMSARCFSTTSSCSPLVKYEQEMRYEGQPGSRRKLEKACYIVLSQEYLLRLLLSMGLESLDVTGSVKHTPPTVECDQQELLYIVCAARKSGSPISESSINDEIFCNLDIPAPFQTSWESIIRDYQSNGYL